VLSRPSRPAQAGVAASHPKKRERRGEREGEGEERERDLRERRERGDWPPLSVQWSPAMALAASVANQQEGERERERVKEEKGGAAKNQNRGRMAGIRNQRKNDQERIDNSALVVGMYNQDSCIPVANFFTINLLSGRTEDVRT